MELIANKVLILFGGGDGGGFWIDGAGHLHRIPPWNPELLAELKAAAIVLEHASKINNDRIKTEMNALAENIFKANAEKIAAAVGK